MIGIIDYGLGNINAIRNIYHRLNIPTLIVNNKDDLLKATKLILPGVGSFDWAMESLNNSSMRNALDELIIGKSIPVLGICVGMQMMAKSSEEGKLEGLKWIDAKVKKFDLSDHENIFIPHMGWNSIKVADEHPLFNNINQLRGFYFLHSYYVHCNEPSIEIARCNLGFNFTTSFSEHNIFGVQFHPEKSHANGIQLFKNFAQIEIS